MTELRYNPLLGTWTMVAAARQNRPHMRKDSCPFCPGQGRLKDYDVLKYDNDFPAMMAAPPAVKKSGSQIYKNAPSQGKCEVILYSSDHNKSLHELPRSHIERIVDLWAKRCRELSRDKKNKFIFVFENRGEEVGVTMLHPHGQIYAYPFVPLKLKLELENARAHHKRTGSCLICDMNAEEERQGVRIIYKNSSFMVYLPYFTDYPYGIFISSINHRPSFTSLSKDERSDLADALKVSEGAFEKIFNRPFPFMMCSHQAPVNSPEYKGSEKYFHLHIEFYTPLRAKDKVKWYASSESGAWAAANVACVEDTAGEIRAAMFKYFAEKEPEKFIEEFRAHAASVYGKGGDFRVFAAPARVNIIGEHTDYNGGLVMPAAVGLKTYLAVRKRKDKKIKINSMNFRGEAAFAAGKKNVFNKELMWVNYPAGVLNELARLGYSLDSGFEAVLFSEIPADSGVSSSAALEVVFAHALSEMYGFRLSKKETALLSQRAENGFVGVACGIMDQFASAVPEKKNPILLDCASLKYEYLPFNIKGYSLVIANTAKQRGLKDSKYNERLSECRSALKGLKKKIKIEHLCAITPSVFEKNKEFIMDKTALKRAKHAVYENDRVKKAVKAMKEGSAEALGKLLIESHVSLRDDYEVTGPELDAMFESGINQKGCAGGRMTGAGFGGCAIFLVKKSAVHDFKMNVAAEYRRKTGLMPDFYDVDFSKGACEVGRRV